MIFFDCRIYLYLKKCGMQCKKLSADVYHTLKNSFLIKADFQHIGNRAPKIDVEKLAARMKELGIPD